MFFRKSGDISAVVLTIGEPTTQAAIDSLRKQTMEVSDIIVVRDTRPFHKALNEGVRQVSTKYFMQVDADMILDRRCLAKLRNAMTPNTGIAVGYLRDDLMRQVVGIKLFRTECFAAAQFRDSISPDTDFADEIERAGWQTVYVGRRRFTANGSWTTLGEHRPDYTAAYTYRKYLMEGRRYRHRRNVGGLRWYFGQLEQSRHPAALVAQIGLSRGFFRDADVDALGRIQGDEEFARLEAFLAASAATHPSGAVYAASEHLPQQDRFRNSYRNGKTMFDANDATTFRRYMTLLNSKENDPSIWIAKMALCQGLLAATSGDAEIEADYARLSDFLSAADHGIDITRSPNIVVSGQGVRNDLILNDIMTYAERAGLHRFLIAPSFAAQFSVSADEHTFCTTNADVISEIDARGRPRIKAPFQLFGHVVCDEPERIGGLFWCLDLLKSGYVFGHVPTSFGAYRVIFPWLIVRHLLSRCGWPPISLAGPNRLSAALSRVTKPRKPTYEPEPGRVLMMTEDLGRGGSERQLVAATAGLLRRDCDVKMFLLKRLGLGEPNYEDDVVRLGIAPEYASDTVRPARICMRHRPDGLSPADCAALPPWLSDGVLKAAEAIARHRPTVVHGWLDRPGIVAALAACAAGVPRIVIQIGSMAISRRNGMASELLRQAYKALARNPSVTIVNNSAAGARDNEKWIGLKPQSIGVLHNGFLPETARRPSPDDTARYRESLGLSAGLVVGTVMRFVPEKDPDLWLDTAAEIAKVRPDVRFLIAGFGALERSIKARIDTLGLTDRVALVGPVTDSGLAYSAMDVVLLSSAIEGTPNVVIEAQAVGCPVVATDVGGTSEALVEGRTGLIARPRSAASLAKAVITILGDVEWQNRVRTEGPDFVSRRFGFERMIDETLRHYGFETPLPASRLRAHSS